jgi:Lrp/AsnC family transcriptional regulator of ectoine degradation
MLCHATLKVRKGMKKPGLDATDIRILSAVQKHGQLSKTRLAEIVNLSPTPCLARLNRLKELGYIRGYHAEVALERVCDPSQVVVTVSLTHHRKADFQRFEDHVRRLDEVTECVATGGGMDYVLKVVTHSLVAFQEVMDLILSTEVEIDRYGLARVWWRAFSSLHGRFARRRWGFGSRAMSVA